MYAVVYCVPLHISSRCLYDTVCDCGCQVYLVEIYETVCHCEIWARVLDKLVEI